MDLYTEDEAGLLLAYYKDELIGLPLFEGSKCNVTEIIIQPFRNTFFMVTCISEIEPDLKLKNSLRKVALLNNKILPFDYLKTRENFNL